MKQVQSVGPDIVEKNGQWRTSTMAVAEAYRIHAIGKNVMSDDCELLIDASGIGAPSWEKAALFEIINDTAPVEWIVRTNFLDDNDHGDSASWSILIGWPEMFRRGHLVGLMNRDSSEMAKFVEMVRSRNAAW